MSSSQPGKKRKRRAARIDPDIPESNWYDITDSDQSDWESWIQNKIKKRRLNEKTFHCRHLSDQFEQYVAHEDLSGQSNPTPSEGVPNDNRFGPSGQTSGLAGRTRTSRPSGSSRPHGPPYSHSTNRNSPAHVAVLEEERPPTPHSLNRHLRDPSPAAFDEGPEEGHPVFVPASEDEDGNRHPVQPDHLEEPPIAFPDTNEENGNHLGPDPALEEDENRHLEEPPIAFPDAIEENGNQPGIDLEEDQEFIDDEDFFINEEDSKSMINSLAHLWVVATVSHNISVQGASYLWKLAFQWIGRIFEKRNQENNSKKMPQFPHLRRKIIDNKSPAVVIQLGFKNLETGNIESPEPSNVAHLKQYSDVTKFRKSYEITSVPLKSALKIRSNICSSHQQFNNEPMRVNLSCDGVADAKSNTVSLDIFSISFPECSNVYPILVVKSEEKGNVCILEQLGKILEEMRENNVILNNLLCDNPMRCLLKNVKNHSSYRACDYCNSCAVIYKDPQFEKYIEKERKLHGIRKKELQKEIEALTNLPGTSKDNLIEVLQERQKNDDDELANKIKKKKRVRDNKKKQISLSNFLLKNNSFTYKKTFKCYMSMHLMVFF